MMDGPATRLTTSLGEGPVTLDRVEVVRYGGRAE